MALGHPFREGLLAAVVLPQVTVERVGRPPTEALNRLQVATGVVQRRGPTDAERMGSHHPPIDPAGGRRQVKQPLDLTPRDRPPTRMAEEREPGLRPAVEPLGVLALQPR